MGVLNGLIRSRLFEVVQTAIPVEHAVGSVAWCLPLLLVNSLVGQQACQQLRCLSVAKALSKLIAKIKEKQNVSKGFSVDLSRSCPDSHANHPFDSLQPAPHVCVRHQTVPAGLFGSPNLQCWGITGMATSLPWNLSSGKVANFPAYPSRLGFAGHTSSHVPDSYLSWRRSQTFP